MLILVCKVVSAVSLSASFWSTSACNAAKAAALVPLVAIISVSTYVFTDFTVGNFTSDAPSVATSVDLLAVSSFKAVAFAAVVAFVLTVDVKVLILVCKVVSAVSLSASFWLTSACNAAKAVALVPLVAVISAST